MGSLSPSSSSLARKRYPEFGFLVPALVSSTSLLLTKAPPVTATMMPTLTSAHPFCARSSLSCAPSLDPPQLRRWQSFVIRKSRTAIVSAAVISLHFLDAEVPFQRGKKTLVHSSWPSSSETPVWMHNTNASADVSPCNGISAILGQHKAFPDRDDIERTRPVTTSSARTSQPICPHFV